jgi:sulfur carrier protein ThiS
MHLHLGGHLSWYAPERAAHLEVPLDAPRRLLDLLDALGVPAGEVAAVLVNRHPVQLDDATVNDDDRADLYPPVGGGGG